MLVPSGDGFFSREVSLPRTRRLQPQNSSRTRRLPTTTPCRCSSRDACGRGSRLLCHTPGHIRLIPLRQVHSWVIRRTTLYRDLVPTQIVGLLTLIFAMRFRRALPMTFRSRWKTDSPSHFSADGLFKVLFRLARRPPST